MNLVTIKMVDEIVSTIKATIADAIASVKKDYAVNAGSIKECIKLYNELRAEARELEGKAKDGLRAVGDTVNELSAIVSTIANKANEPGADGKDGAGIDSFELDASGNLSVSLSDGRKLQVKDFRPADGSDGKDGKDGEDGTGIDLVDVNEGDILVKMTDGREFYFPRLKGLDGLPGKDGLDGKDGADGRGVKDAYLAPNGDLQIEFTDGIDKTITLPRGADGVKGLDGKDGRDGVDGKDGINGLDGKDGVDGTKGIDGANGLPGLPGKDGVSVKDVDMNADGELVIVLSDNPDVGHVVGRVKGADGQDGKDAEPGKDGRDGVDGVSIASIEQSQRDAFSVVLSDGQKHVVSLPIPRDGKDGDSVKGEPGKDGVDGKDGIGLAGAIIDRSGNLVVTTSTGDAKELGPVVGKDGAPGLPGRDGADGFGFDDLEFSHDGERGFALKFVQGERVKEFAFTIPVPLYRGIHEAGKAYERGDMVTRGGSLFHANEATKSTPETDTTWQLAAKRGRDGAAGKKGDTGRAGEPGRNGKDLTQMSGDVKW